MLRQGACATCNGLGECLDLVPVQPCISRGTAAADPCYSRRP